MAPRNFRIINAVISVFCCCGDPCSKDEWPHLRMGLWEVVGDGTSPDERLVRLKAAKLHPMQVSTCLHGAVSLHLLHIIHASPSTRVEELKSAGDDILAVIFATPWAEEHARWPLFGLMHLLQYQLMLDGEEIGQERWGKWAPLHSDDHMRFRNWIYSHLVEGQTPPLVDSVHFLARADTRNIEIMLKECSAAKAMGYLATALVYSQESDAALRVETRDLVAAAENHVKSCARDANAGFSLLQLLRSEWPLSWLLHSVLMHLDPPTAHPQQEAVGLDASRLLEGFSIKPTVIPSLGATLSPVLMVGRQWLYNFPAEVRSAIFHSLGKGLYVADMSRFEDLFARRDPAGASGSEDRSAMVQMFRGGLPLRRAASTISDCFARPSVGYSEPFWSASRLWGHILVSVYDTEFLSSSVSYEVSTSAFQTIGIYSEPGSASDPYNVEWLAAYRVAATKLGLVLHEAVGPQTVRQGGIYFWRINQMFDGGRLAGAAGVGAAIAEHLQGVVDRSGAVFWPRPESARVYQDKLALRTLFHKVGVPCPKSWVASSLSDLDQLLSAGELRNSDFPLMLKHPFASSSRGMVGCDSADEIRKVLAAWLAEHRVPCLLQKRIRIARDLRLTYVGGEIVQGYWRVKPHEDVLTTGTSYGGSRLDFNVQTEEFASFVRDFASRTGLDIGGMDIAFPDDGSGIVVFEVSPTFDLNPRPPLEWENRPYKEYAKTRDFINRRAENYAMCAEKILAFALGKRGRLFVDVDNTVSASFERLRRAALPAWPGETFNAALAFSASELASDRPFPNAATAIAGAARDWEVHFLTARGYPGAFESTAKWLDAHRFQYERLIVVKDPSDKVAWLTDARDWSPAGLAWVRPNPGVLLVDDLTTGHHKAEPIDDNETRGLLQSAGIPFELHRPLDETQWLDLSRRLAARAATATSGSQRSHPSKIC